MAEITETVEPGKISVAQRPANPWWQGLQELYRKLFVAQSLHRPPKPPSATEPAQSEGALSSEPSNLRSSKLLPDQWWDEYSELNNNSRNPELTKNSK